MATPSKRRKSSKNVEVNDCLSEADEASAGIVEYIQLKNFMCHSNLEFKFGEKLNFITGQNGSGKSAVLSGLVIGLGGKASSMNRGGSIKDYIKSGCYSSEIIVTLSNRGPDAYKEDQYGKRIVVQRKFTDQGTSNYRILNSDGNVISSKLADLTKILDHFNIQLENPITILSQDVSRQFLQSMKPNKLYQFFMNGTQLQKLYDELQETKTIVQATQQTIENRKKAIPSLQAAVNELKERISKHESLDEWRTQLADCRRNLEWAKVLRQERLIHDLSQQIEDIDRNCEKSAKLVEDKQLELVNLEQDAADTSASLYDFDKQFELKRCDLKKSESQSNELRRQIMTQQVKIESLERELQNLKNERSQLRNALDELSFDHDKENQKTEISNRLKQIEDEKSEIEHLLTTHEEHCRTLTSQKQNYDHDRRRIDAELLTSNRKVITITQQLADLKASEGNRYARFGRFTPQLLSLMDQAYRQRRFSQMPRGPLGALFSVKDQTWTLAIENCIGDLAFAYACDNFEDSRVLEELFRQCQDLRRRPRIIVSRFFDRKHDVSSNVPRCIHPTVLSMLEIDDPVVFNCLVDQAGIEEVVLIQCEREMRKIMHDLHPPAKKSYSASGDNCVTKPSFRFYPANRSQARLLTASIAPIIDNLAEELRLEKENVTRCQMEKQQISEDINGLQNKINGFENEIQGYKRQIDQRHRKLNDFKRDLAEISSRPMMLGGLETELKDCDSKVSELGNRLDVAKNEFQNLQSEIASRQKAVETAKRSYQEMCGEKSNLQDKLDTVTRQKTNIQLWLQRSTTEKRDVEITRQQKQNDKESSMAALQVLEDAARQVCNTRLKPKKTPEQIETEIGKLERRLRAGEEEIGDYQELMIQQENKSTELACREKEITEICTSFDLLEQSINKRKKKYYEMRHNLSVSMSQNFLIHLNLRHFEGKLNVDHQEKIICIQVAPPTGVGKEQEQDSSSANGSIQCNLRDLKGLSGGERSFVTVCFLLSMWRLMDAPFRFLDEFDVFMDADNRKTTTAMIVSMAQSRQISGQLALLTPIDLELLRSDARIVKVFELQPPRDGNGQLQNMLLNQTANSDDDKMDDAQ